MAKAKVGQVESRPPTRVTAEEVLQRQKRGEPLVFVDARNSQSWNEGQTIIPGAIRVPANEVEQHLPEIPRHRTVITYCTCPHEASSAQVAQSLIDHGWNNVHPMYGGLEAWVALNGKTERKTE